MIRVTYLNEAQAKSTRKLDECAKDRRVYITFHGKQTGIFTIRRNIVLSTTPAVTKTSPSCRNNLSVAVTELDLANLAVLMG